MDFGMFLASVNYITDNLVKLQSQVRNVLDSSYCCDL